jgi:hypothetical protein
VDRVRLRRTLGALAGATALAALGAPSQAAAALTATGADVAARPAYHQVVIPVSGGTLTGLERQVDAPDPSPGDGRAVVRVNGPGITARAVTVRRGGVSVRLTRRPGSVLAILDGPPGGWKFVSYAVDGSRTRLVIRLWRTTLDARARILDDGCLRLTRWTARGVVRARGLELQPLFEHGLVLSLRREGAGGRTMALRPLTAIEGTFLPDFSGYARPGTWSGRLSVAVAAPIGTSPAMRTMLEAWSTSAKDGSLDCLVQTPVILRP